MHMNVAVRRAVEADLPRAPEPWRRRQVGLSGWVRTALVATALAVLPSLGAGQERPKFEVAVPGPRSVSPRSLTDVVR
jgi:hypothetical protein